ncbi:hypothetical protein EVJ58_g1907 [Rhodofomes roseus]|uniref:Uncharacterized protein n=1 Tax=Rhodofomes roseus TaxID=34475 RepID=A0A4Y9YZ10_9APHY|nr:hypothetical protein EVJ58_g1907 [Rhodofomes roseus]
MADLKDQTIHIRLAGVDAPEAAHFGKPAQEFAQESLAWLKYYIEGRFVYCQLCRKDQYGRIVAHVHWKPRILPGSLATGKSVPIEMLQHGWAEVYEQSGAEHGQLGVDEFLRVQGEAQTAKRGIWKYGLKRESAADYKKRYASGDTSKPVLVKTKDSMDKTEGTTQAEASTQSVPLRATAASRPVASRAGAHIDATDATALKSLFSFHHHGRRCTMGVAGQEQTPKKPVRASRVLAALDNPGFFASQAPAAASLPPATPLLSGTKRPFDTPGASGSGSQKRTRRPGYERENTPSGVETSVTQMTMLVGASQGGFRLNYDQEGGLLPLDLGGEDQQMRLAEFVTRSIDNSANGVSVKAAMEKLGLRNKRDLLPGMEVRLLPHQILGVAWMMNQERVSPHKGGILADEMGLGKTVQMIATMAINLPEPEDKHRTTLVVVPAALLQQWKDELLTKTNGIFSVHIHHGKDKLKSVSALSKKDVIITTYHTLCGDFTIPSGIESEDEMEYLMDNGGLLSQMKWYRVIADESQFIRNRRTRSSKAVAMLRAKYRWCLTGTPVTNTLVWKDFNEYIAKEQLRDAPLAGLRAQEILKPLLLRRTKDAEIEGEPLLQLPEKHIELEYLEFSDEERQLYDSFEGRAQTQINRFLRDGSLLKNTSVVLEQAQGFEDPTMLVASDAEKEVARASKLMGPEWVTQVKKRFMARARMAQLDFSDDMEQDEEATCPKCGDFFMEGSGRLLACGHELCNDCLLALRTERMEVNEEFGNGDEKENMRVEKEFEAAALKGLRPCPTCKKMQDLSPAHVFLSQAFEPLRDDPMSRVVKKEPIIIDSDLEMSSSSDEDMPDLSELLAGAASSSQSSSEKKKESKAKVKGRTVMSDDDDSPMDEDNDLHNTMDKIRGKRVQKSKAPADDDSDDDGPRQVPAYMVNTWRRGDDNLEPSTKMMALINHLQEWEVTGDKTIVYSQWTSMLDLIETLFQRYGIRSLRYDGKMSRDARELVLSEFRQRGGPKVILISIKCGGVGLNLVSANRIINMDLSWNYASESQAYDRVHRLGQEKEVFIKRLIVKNTIEERMLRLQDTKTGLAEAALGEGSGVKLHKLSVKELKAVRFSSLRVLVYALTRSCVKLFGMNKDNRPQAGQQTLDDNQQQ